MKFVIFSWILFNSFLEISALKCKQSQESVTSEPKLHALYLWLQLQPQADPRVMVKIAANLSKHIDHVNPNKEIKGGVGFGKDLYNKVSKVPKDFAYKKRTGIHGDMPSTEGDIFIHCKSEFQSSLFELAEYLLEKFEKKNLKQYEDIYGFTYKEGRDLSGFIDGTANPSGDHREKVAVECSSGGSFMITQKWVHDLDFIHNQKDPVLESFIGRKKKDSSPLKPLPKTSHVSRILRSDNADSKKPFEIVRQSQPFGTLSSEAGLLFIAYANSTKNFDFMLDGMVGKEANLHDDIMRISKNTKGNFWFVPGEEELNSFLK